VGRIGASLMRGVRRLVMRVARSKNLLRYALAGAVVAASSLVVAAAEPYSLKGSWEVAADVSEALTAAAVRVTALGYSPDEFRATVSCDASYCEMGVYPRELDIDAKYRSHRGCPLKYCATLTYSKSSRSITNEVGWR